MSAPVVKMPPQAAPPSPDAPMGEPEIHVIPDKFYGAALRAKFEEKKKVSSDANAPAPAAHGPGWVIPVMVGVILLLGVAGGFVWFNKGLLFPPPPAPVQTPVVQTPPPPPPPPVVPATPANLSATTTAPTVVALSWEDVSNNEAGFRVERRESSTSYSSVTSLGPNATAWQDQSVRPETDYLYRIFAINEGGASTSSNEASVRTPAEPVLPEPGPTLPPAGLDSDSDGLTDLEEPLYGSPLRDPDADKDSYNDGNEVFHLYSPSGRAPGKLLESGLVKAVTSPVGWSLYVPTPWLVTVEPDGLKATIAAAGRGELFLVSVENAVPGQSLLDWYLARNPGVLSSQVKTIVTKSGYEGLEGADQLTAYFPWGSKIFVVRYDLDAQPFVNYRTTFEMMKNSLSLTSLPVVADAIPATVPASDARIPSNPETPVSSDEEVEEEPFLIGAEEDEPESTLNP